MPTGYTSIIQESEETNSDKLFRQFALQCARAFGALVSMRDDKWDAEIPDEIVAGDYYKNGIAEHKKELAIARKRSMVEWEKLATEDYNRKYNYYKDEITKAANLRAKYQAILDKVRAYNPPTQDHLNYKNFMFEQIQGSLDFDCNTDYYNREFHNLTRTPAKEFKQKTIKNLEDSLKYDQEHYKKELEGCKKQTAWIKALKKSLGVKPNGAKVQS